MATHSKSTRKATAGTKLQNPPPKSTDQAQNVKPNVEEGFTYHTSSNIQPTNDDGQPTASTEPHRSRGRPKKTVVDRHTDSMGQEPVPAEVVAPRKRGRKAATLTDDGSSQPPTKRTKKGKAIMTYWKPYLREMFYKPDAAIS